MRTISTNSGRMFVAGREIIVIKTHSKDEIVAKIADVLEKHPDNFRLNGESTCTHTMKTSYSISIWKDTTQSVNTIEKKPKDIIYGHKKVILKMSIPPSRGLARITSESHCKNTSIF